MMKNVFHAWILFICGCYQSHGGGMDSSIEVIYDTSFVDHVGCMHPVCDIVPQCGCPEGFMCTLVFSTPGPVRACVPPGDGQPGEACEFFECAPENICYGGVCRIACMNEADCPPDNECVWAIEGESLRACSLTCDLIDGEPCLEGWKCVAHRSSIDNEKFFSDCEVSTGDTGFREGCSDSSDCVQGIGCTDECEIPFCIKICQEDSSCPPSVPVCGSDSMIGIINGIAYGWCEIWYDTDCYDY